MRKTWKRALSLVLSAALVVTAGAFGAESGLVKAADDISIDFTAQFEAFGNLWNADWVSSVTPVVSGDAWKVNVTELNKDYTVKVTAPCDATVAGALVVNTDLEYLPADYKMVGKTLKIGDQELDWSKAESYLDSDKLRLSIWNEWGSDDKANPCGMDLTINEGDEIEATFSVVERTDKPVFTAWLENWGGMWDWTASTPATLGAWKIPIYETTPNSYKVKLVAPGDANATSSTLALNTDLTALPTDYSIVGSMVKVTSADGENAVTYDWSNAKAYVDGTNVRVSIFNNNVPASDKNGNPLTEEEIEAFTINAGDTIEATFNVVANTSSGDNNTPGGNNPTATPPAPTDTKQVNGTAKGKTFTAGNFKYKVTTAATITSVSKKKTAGKVTVTGLSAAGKKKTSISLKNTVTKGTASYKVTAVASKAFQKATKLKKATLGSNITTIPASAFNADKKLTTVKATGVTKIQKSAFKGCKVLKKLTLGKKKLTSVAKKSFTGCKKKITVSGGTKKVKKANVTKLKKSGYKKFK